MSTASRDASARLSVSVHGSSTVSPLVAPLRAALDAQGIEAEISCGDPGAFALEIAQGQQSRLTVCLLDAEVVLQRVRGRWTTAALQEAADEVLTLLRDLVDRHVRQGPGTLAITTAPLWQTLLAQVLDLTERAGVAAVWRRFEAELLELAVRHDAVQVIDLSALATSVAAARDARLEAYAAVAYTTALLEALAAQLTRLVAAQQGAVRKCLVLDLDGTTWAGVLAESGPDGLQMREGPRGQAHRRFQQVVRRLHEQGVLLAVCSKNDPLEVESTLREHPDLLLRWDDFTTVVAAWEPKVEGVRRIAERIGIGLDSLVLVDDDDTEAGLVAQELPQVAVVHVDHTDPAGHVDRLLAAHLFDSPRVTDEDRARQSSYRARAELERLRRSDDGPGDYLAELQTTVEIFVPEAGDVPRVAQLSQRTNQFTLTTLRLEAPTVQRMLQEPQSVVLAARVSDRFGEHGLVAGVIAHWELDTLVVDNMMMSCRVLGRGVETACLAEVLRWAAHQGADRVQGRYVASPRNARVADLYPQHGFRATTPAGTGEQWFVHDLHALADVPACVTVHARLPELPARARRDPLPRAAEPQGALA